MSSLLHFSASYQRNQETTKNSQKLKTYSAPTVGNKVSDIGGHHRAITNREDTVSHHRLIVRLSMTCCIIRQDATEKPLKQ